MSDKIMYRIRPTLTILRSMDSSVESQAKTFKHSETIEELNKIFPLDLPKNFDGRQIWSKYLSPVKDQGNCGACWAFATSSTLADRLAILTLGQLKVELSPGKMILCDWGNDTETAYPVLTTALKAKIKENIETNVACNRNSIQQALTYLFKFGTSEESCIPYDLGDFPDLGEDDSEKIPLCQTIVGYKFDRCLTGQPMRTFRVNTMYILHSDSITNYARIKYEIYRWGPIVSGFLLYPDFYSYNPVKDGIYIPKPDQEYNSGHAIEIVVWGIQMGTNGDGDIPYWVIRNSWGSDWGENGYFKCQMGNPMLDIEVNAMACIPDVPGLTEETFIQDSVIETEKDIQIRQHYKVHESGYPYTIVNAVLNKKLYGIDLSPIISRKKIPDMSKFVAGKLTDDDYVGDIVNYQVAPKVFKVPQPTIDEKPISLTSNKTNAIEVTTKINNDCSKTDKSVVQYTTLCRCKDYRWLLLALIIAGSTLLYWLKYDKKCI